MPDYSKYEYKGIPLLESVIIYYTHPVFGRFRRIIKRYDLTNASEVHKRWKKESTDIIELRSREGVIKNDDSYFKNNGFNGRQIIAFDHKDFTDIIAESKRKFQKTIRRSAKDAEGH